MRGAVAWSVIESELQGLSRMQKLLEYLKRVASPERRMREFLQLAQMGFNSLYVEGKDVERKSIISKRAKRVNSRVSETIHSDQSKIATLDRILEQYFNE